MLKELIPYVFPTASPEECGIPSASVSAFIDRLNSEGLCVEGFMVCRHGKVIARALAEPYKVTDKRHVYSISKSYTGSAIGIARDEGLCDVDDRIIDIFPEYVPENPSENLKKMKIHHLLSMNTGHDCDTTGAIMNGGDNWVKTFMSLPVEHEPGTKFVYNSGASYMLSAIITKLTGMTLLEYLTPRLFNPLGIKGVWWDACPRGINLGGWGLHVSVRDMLKLGVLYLNGGMWGKMRVISQDWVKLASTSHSDNSAAGGSPDWKQGYCYQMWRCQHDCFRGDGAFGQLIIISPKNDMVLSLISEDNRFQQLCDAYWDTIFAAAEHNASDAVLPENPQDLAAMGRACVAFGSIPKLSNALTRPLNLSFRMGPNDVGVEHVSIHTDARSALITLSDDKGHKWFVEAGSGEWYRNRISDFPVFITEMMVSGSDRYRRAELACTFSRISETVVQVNIQFTDAPHGIDYTVDTAAMTVTSRRRIWPNTTKIMPIAALTKEGTRLYGI